MKAFTTVCLLGLLVAAFSVVAVIAQGERARPNQDARALPAPEPASVAQTASLRLLAVMHELLEGRSVACERIVWPLLGLDEDAELAEEQLFRVLLGLGEDDEIDRERLAVVLGLRAGQPLNCEWAFRTMLGLGEGETVDNEQLVRLLLGIDEQESLDTEQVLRRMETTLAGARADR